MPAFTKLGPEEVAIEGFHEEVLGLLLHFIVPSAVDLHDALIMDLLLLFQSSFCLGFDASTWLLKAVFSSSRTFSRRRSSTKVRRGLSSSL